MAVSQKREIRGFLIDMDGVLYVGENIIAGAREALHFLQKQQIPFLLLTNTTQRSRFGLANRLQRMGFRVDISRIFSAPFAAAQWLKQRRASTVYLFTRGDVYREFSEFKQTTYKPEYVVLGDVGEYLSYDRLNQVFRMVMDGARMVALQKNRFWRKEEGLVIDAGAIVAALEYATRKRAVLIGKPSRAFFQQAIQLLDLPPGEMAIIGDDLEADIAGGHQAGLFTIAVRTGKYREEDLQKAKVKPDLILNSIGELPQLFQL